jgi:NitT/TauT family transport system permease protein
MATKSETLPERTVQVDGTAVPLPAAAVQLPRQRKWRDSLWVLLGLHIVLIAGFLSFWQFASIYLIPPVWISSPVLVSQRLVQLLMNGSLLTNTWATLQVALIGLALGTILGLTIALVMNRFPYLGKVIWPYLMLGYAMPRIALAPFFVMWFGIGLLSKVLLVISVVVFVILFNVRQGLETVDADHVDAMTSMRASKLATMRYVSIPTVIPWLVAGIKIAVGQALVSAVVAEMVGSTQGLGWLVTDSLNRFDMSGAITALIIMVILARGLYFIISLIESQLFKWRRTAGGGTADLL